MDKSQPVLLTRKLGRSSSPIRKMIAGGIVLTSVCGFGIVGYLLAGWDFGDAGYMVIITIFGVGYGEVQPIESWPLRLLTTTVIVGGYGAVIYTIGGFIQMVVDGELNAVLGVRKMTREIDKLDGHVVVCGLGRMGQQLASELQAAGKIVVAIDVDQAVVEHRQAQGLLAIVGDASNEEVLSQAGIERAAVLSTVLSDDAANVFVTLTARSMRADLFIVARGETHRTEDKLLRCGADQVVLPTTIGASKLSRMILRPTADELFDELDQDPTSGMGLGNFGLEFDEVVIEAGSMLADRTLGELDVRGAHGYLVFGIRHADGTTILHPPAETHLGVGDRVIVLGYEDDLLEFGAKSPRPLSAKIGLVNLRRA